MSNFIAMESPSSVSKPVFFFIPDISGFTSFISDRDFQHQQYIIAELLEVLLETNPLGLQVNEVEGDAIFFYKAGAAPSMDDLVNQANQMYLAFHHHLKKYGVSRLCNCPTCKSASRLTLKFIAHQGTASIHYIKEREKLFGKDVILVHRLLKNNIPQREYLLVTDSMPVHPASLPEAWQPSYEQYDFGDVHFRYLPLDSWYSSVPEPTTPAATVYRVTKPQIHTINIAAPIEAVYDSLIDLSQRKLYMVGMKGLSISDNKHNQLNRICTTFECSMEHDKCTFETSSVERTDDRLSFSETFKEHPITFEYLLERNDDHTSLSLEIHPALRIPKKWLFDLMIRRKLNKDSKQTLANLKRYCEEKSVNRQPSTVSEREP